MWQTEIRQKRKHESWQIVALETRHRIGPLKNTQDELLDKEAKNYEEK